MVSKCYGGHINQMTVYEGLATTSSPAGTGEKTSEMNSAEKRPLKCSIMTGNIETALGFASEEGKVANSSPEISESAALPNAALYFVETKEGERRASFQFQT